MTTFSTVKAKTAFNNHRSSAKGRGIEFLLTFGEWMDAWIASGHWANRGRGRDRYAMCRVGDSGPYALGNIYFATNAENIAHAAVNVPDRGAPELPLWEAFSIPPTKAPESVVQVFSSTSDAIKWSYANRSNPGGKTIAWLAHHMGMKRQRLSRVLNFGDFKMDPARVHLWDCLVGNCAVSQYVELEKQRINAAAAEVIQQALQARFAA